MSAAAETMPAGPSRERSCSAASLKAVAAERGFKMTLLNPLRLPVDDSFDAILECDRNLQEVTA